MITNAEMDRRWAATRGVMSELSLDWIVATEGQPFGYLRWLTDRFGVGGPLVAVPIEGDVLFASHGDAVHHVAHDSYGVRHLVSCSQPNVLVNNQAPLLIEEMRSRPLKRIGIAGTGFLPLATYNAIRSAFPEAEIVDVDTPMARIKAFKSAEEMVHMRAAAAMHDAAVELAGKTIRAGITAKDVVDEVRYFVTRAGSFAQALVGGSAPPGTPCKYGGPMERVIQPGDQVSLLIECSEANGYYSEAMPTFCLGDAPAALKNAMADAIEIQEELVAMVRPGMTSTELLAHNDAYMSKRGYPAEGRLLGHAQGYDLVERPAFSPLGENLPIEHDMVLSIHPTVHTDGAWGYPNNLSFHFTANGMERMLTSPNGVIEL